ncbi:Transcriptional regulator TetR family [Patulibacter medicamentivorans]|uniref:Transcriptional regulator TetR family n=1 Tax=Patulibacter medicamentivorans TaxID=1097667 RepID=H0E3F0_9ACTN|nr:TetR/AcrR family transcriptional regulator [Patulibacter medicamentivorans]EHN11802.1 Transcriptional regulator TetR family [Patulibacter medicamentivorans]
MHVEIFTAAVPLPKGPHGLPREQVAASQRMRLMGAMAQLLGEGGYAAVTIGALARRASVSRAAFYEQFADKQECLLAAYDHFAAALVTAMTAELEPDTPWSAFIDSALLGYLATLERNPVVARAFLIEMEGAGPAARERRRSAVGGFAALIGDRHAAIRRRDPSLGPLSDRAYLAIAVAVRGLVVEALEQEREPRLTALAPEIVDWITALVLGAGRAA